ncbi:hypothetical protein YPPY48_0838, partial [Yersinia pestis PY-48]
MDIRSRQHIF